MSHSVNKHYIASYKELLEDPERQSLAREVAYARTLAMELRDSIEASSKEKLEVFLGLVRDMISENLSAEETDQVMSSVEAVYSAVFQPMSRITAKDALAMLAIHKGAADIAEKYRKIQENLTVRLEFDPKLQEFLIKFVSRGILPYIPMESRIKVAQSVRNMLPQLSGDVIDVN